MACVLLFGIHLANIARLHGLIAVETPVVVGLLVCLLFIVMGNYLGKVRSNFMFGVRTPWTLSSDLSWNKTHRLAGGLFMLAGMSGLISHLFVSAMAIQVTVGALLLAVLISVVYSYLVWRTDPERRLN